MLLELSGVNSKEFEEIISSLPESEREEICFLSEFFEKLGEIDGMEKNNGLKPEKKEYYERYIYLKKRAENLHNLRKEIRDKILTLSIEEQNKYFELVNNLNALLKLYGTNFGSDEDSDEKFELEIDLIQKEIDALIRKSYGISGFKEAIKGKTSNILTKS